MNVSLNLRVFLYFYLQSSILWFIFSENLAIFVWIICYLFILPLKNCEEILKKKQQ